MRTKIINILVIFVILIILLGITNNHEVMAVTKGASAVYLPLVFSHHYTCAVDNFDSTELRNEWYWIREDPTHWSLSANPGFLRIITQNKDIWREYNTAPILLQQLQPSTYESFSIRTRILLEPQEEFQQGGLVIYQDDDNYVRLTYNYITFGHQFEFGKELQQEFYSIQVPAPKDVNDFHIQITKIGMNYTAYYSMDGNSWTVIGTYNSVNIMPNQIGLIAFSSPSIIEIPADFDYFQYCR